MTRRSCWGHCPAIVVRHREVSAARDDSANFGVVPYMPRAKPRVPSIRHRAGRGHPHPTGLERAEAGTQHLRGVRSSRGEGGGPRTPTALTSPLQVGGPCRHPGRRVSIYPTWRPRREPWAWPPGLVAGRRKDFPPCPQTSQTRRLGFFFFFMPPNSPCPGPRVPAEASDGHTQSPPMGVGGRRPSNVSDPQPAALTFRGWRWGVGAGGQQDSSHPRLRVACRHPGDC